jgi:hypothetical protein
VARDDPETLARAVLSACLRAEDATWAASLCERLAGTSVAMIERVDGHFRNQSYQDAQARLDRERAARGLCPRERRALLSRRAS